MGHSRITGLALLGLPSDHNSTFARGCAEAPRLIRNILYDGCANFTSEHGIDLDEHPMFRDAGDLQLPDDDGMLRVIEAGVDDLLGGDEHVLSLGGDHAVTYPVLKAYARRYPDLNILHFDAHPDLYDHYEGNRYSHACPFARIMEEGLAGRLVQIGIRTLNRHQREQVERFGVEIIDMHTFDPSMDLGLQGPTYISFDMDGLDPACAPGVSHPEPGGLTTREVLRVLQGLTAPVVGADIVELNPSRDINDLTARVAAKLLKEIAGKMIQVLAEQNG